MNLSEIEHSVAFLTAFRLVNGIAADRRQTVVLGAGFFIQLACGGLVNRFAGFPVASGAFIGVALPVLAKDPLPLIAGNDDGEFEQAVVCFQIKTNLWHSRSSFLKIEFLPED